jgi:hypothetical protein
MIKRLPVRQKNPVGYSPRFAKRQPPDLGMVSQSRAISRPGLSGHTRAIRPRALRGAAAAP